jgi:hypothetical protein
MSHIFAALCLAVPLPGPFSPPSQVESIAELPRDGVPAFVVSLDRVRFTGESPPEPIQRAWLAPRDRAVLAPYAVLDGVTEVYVDLPTNSAWPLGDGRLGLRPDSATDGSATLTGRLYLPAASPPRLVAHPFVLSLHGLTPDAAAFDDVRAARAAALAEAELPGAGWWRHRARLGRPDEREDVSVSAPSSELDRSFALLTGGRALAENLRLDDVMRGASNEVASIPLEELRGVTVTELDFTGRDQCGADGVDPLARFIPADHHGVFFPSFDALAATLDELRLFGTPVLDAVSTRVEDARVADRYARQLALELDIAARFVGPHMVRSVAATGGDPYLRTGSDVALLFECADADAFESFVLARIAERAEATGAVVREVHEGEVRLRGAADAGRDLSSRLVRVGAGAEVALGAAPEFRHFRALYPRGAAEETAFVVLSDATIRRWCGPKWRIASSRRVRAQAVLAEASAARAAQRFGLEPVSAFAFGAPVADFGALTLDDRGPRSERYNTPRFATPIAELDVRYVTPRERDGYESWRMSYERQWSTVFDPIAARLSLGAGRVDVELSVLPIAVRTDYRELIGFAGEERLGADVGVVPRDAVAHVTLALDRDGETLQQLEKQLSFLPGDLQRPLGWVNGYFTAWLDEDPALLAAAREAEDRDEFLGERGFEVPVGVELGVRDPLRLAAFVAALKGLLDSAAPGVMAFETREVALPSGAKRPYVAVEPNDDGGWEDTPSLYYAIVPGRFVLSFREDVVQRALTRTEPLAADAEEGVGLAPTPQVGQSYFVRFAEGFRDVLAVGFVEAELQSALRRRAFSALPILNELHRVAPAEDPENLLLELFGATVRCPGGGRFVWNEEHQTYESTVFGCPAVPRAGEALPSGLQSIRELWATLRFERLDERTHALHVHARVERR